MPTVKRIQKAFRLYVKIIDRQKCYESLRAKGHNGIAVEKDEHALRWQVLDWRREVIESYIYDKSPNYYYHSLYWKKGCSEWAEKMNKEFKGWRD